jgi:uncharacterized RDD family membrane protein YckC
VELDDRVTVAGSGGDDLDLVLAGVGPRGLALLVDLVLQSVMLFAVMAAADAAGGLSTAVVVVAVAVIFLGYPTLAEAFAGGRTVGKAVLGISVVSVDGTPVTFPAAAIRNGLRLVDCLPGVYAVGTIAVLTTRRHQRLGDLAAGTIVVRRAPASSAEEMARWDLSEVTADEVAAMRSFLGRRDDMDLRARAELAKTLSFQILPKVSGVPLEGGPEVFLERVVAAKTAR